MNKKLDSVNAAKELELALNSDSSAKATMWWGVMHSLAESQYLPVIPLFAKCLEHRDWVWRVQCLECLGFHYEIQSDEKLMEKVRQLLLNDPNSDVRMTAASILGIRSTWLDKTLVQALNTDEDYFVKEAAFDALLKLAQIPFPSRVEIVNLLKEGKRQPTVEYLEEVVNKGDLSY